MRINEDSPDRVVIGTEPGQRQLANCSHWARSACLAN